MREKNVLAVLMGEEEFEADGVSDDYRLLAEALNDPNRLVFLLERVMKTEQREDIRHALLRVQIYYTLNMNYDMENNQRRLYVSRTIEKLLFGKNLLEESGAKKRDN